MCLIAETHFTTQSYIKFKGYKVYHTLHPENAAKGGTAIIIKDDITHHVQLEYKTEHIQATTICVRTKNYELNICSIYCPPKHSIKKEQYLEFLNSLGHRYILGGDFNAKNTHWGSRLDTTKGRELLKAIKENGSTAMSTGKPTYWQTKYLTLLIFYCWKYAS